MAFPIFSTSKLGCVQSSVHLYHNQEGRNYQLYSAHSLHNDHERLNRECASGGALHQSLDAKLTLQVGQCSGIGIKHYGLDDNDTSPLVRFAVTAVTAITASNVTKLESNAIDDDPRTALPPKIPSAVVVILWMPQWM